MTEHIKEISTLPPKEYSKKQCKKDLKEFRKRLFELQNLFYADGRYGLLIILQGMDTSGKDGVIRHVMTSMNPMGVNVKSFSKPTEVEERHDFMWRVYPHIPARRMIEVFNRSYYEDIIIPLVNKLQTKEMIQHRFSITRELENHLQLNNIHVLKFFLHISKAEQNERIDERLTIPHKRWKYDKEDKIAASKWNKYMDIYDLILNDCNQNKWNIIPSDKRWYRNYAIAKMITEHIEKLDLKYPK